MNNWALTGIISVTCILFYTLLLWPVDNNGPLLACFHPLNPDKNLLESFFIYFCLIIALCASLFCRRTYNVYELLSLCIIIFVIMMIWFEERKYGLFSNNMKIHVPIVFVGILSVIFLLSTWENCALVILFPLLLFLPLLTKKFGNYLNKKNKISVYNYIWYFFWILIIFIYLYTFSTYM